MSNINDKATVELFVNGEQAEAAMDRLRTKASDLDKALRAALDAGDKKQAAKLQKEIDKVNREINRTESAAKGVGVVLNNLSNTSIHGLRNALKYLQKQLAVTKPDTETWSRYADLIEQVKSRIAELNGELAGSESLWGKFKNWSQSTWPALDLMRQWGGSITDVARDCVDAYASMDQEMANVRKFTGMTAEQVDDLNEEFKKMDTRTSREDLNKLAQEAGRLGKTSKEDILGFVRAADQINVALDDLGEGATLTLSKLTGIFGDEAKYGTEQALLKVGSVINELSQNCSASAPYLAEFASRMGGVGAQAKMTIPQIMGLGAVLDSNALQVEASSTAISQVLVRMMADPAKYAKVAGIEVGKFTTLIREDANSALILFLETLKKSGGMDKLSPMFQEMGENGARAITALSTLALHIDEVKAQQAEANKAFEEGTSVGNEFAVQNETVQAALEKCKNKANELKAELGERLLPLMGHMFNATSALIKATLTIIKFVAEHKAAIVALAAALSAYLLVVKSELVLKKLRSALDSAHYGLLVAKEKIMKRLAVVTEGVRLVYYRLTGQTVKATQAQLTFSLAMKATPWGAIITAVTAFISVLSLFSSSTSKASDETDSLTSAQKKLAAAEKDAEANCAAEVTELDALYKATQDQNLAMADRIAAVKKLQEQYPDYFANLSQEAILAGEAADAYARLRDNIVRSAKAQAHKNLLVDINTEIHNTEREKAEKLEEFVNDAIIPDDAKKRLKENGFDTSIITGYSFIADTVARGIEKLKQDYDTKIERLNAELDEVSDIVTKDTIDSLSENTPDNSIIDRFAQEDAWRTEQEKKAKDSYLKQETDYKAHTAKMDEIAAGYYKRILERTDLTDDERKKYLDEYWKVQSKSTKAAETTLKKSEAAAKLELAKQNKLFKAKMEKAKGDWEADSAYNLMDYTAGAKTYQEYIAEKERLDMDYLDKRIEIYNSLFEGESDVDKKLLLAHDEDYKNFLLKRAELTEKHKSDAAKRDVKLLTDEYNDAVAKLQFEFSSPNSRFYEDTAAQEEELFQLRISYLIKCRNAYNANTREYLDYQKQIDNAEQTRILEKRKTLMQSYEKWVSEYTTLSAERQLEIETKIVQDLYDKKKITAEQYYLWLAQLRENYDSAAESADSAATESKYTVSGPDGKIDIRSDSDMTQQRVDTLDKKRTAALDELRQRLADGLITQEEYDNGVKKIEAAYKKALFDPVRSMLDEQTRQLLDLGLAWADFFKGISENGGLTFDNLKDIASATIATLSSGLQMYSEFIKAQQQIELANVEKRYDREVELAQGNSYKVAKAEKKKEEETQKIKAEYARKEFEVKVVMAVAQTAQNALLGYAAGLAAGFPMATWLAPLLAGLATAQGAVQIALIKKQQQAAAAQGYSKGGFTKPGAVDEPAGIVHAGEWVASQKLLANPVARPMIEALDLAQRTNTIGSLRADDVSRSIRANDSLVRIAESNDGSALLVAAAMQMSQTVSRLNDRLDEPFVTVNTVTGDRGIKQAQDQYSRLINNKSPKSRRNATDN
ncbi:MAG: phage tail tape measure protein [Muribaculaceae bacterium]|nr:phage tail tape measure protein [Muribaculaceae bacterium]